MSDRVVGVQFKVIVMASERAILPGQKAEPIGPCCALGPATTENLPPGIQVALCGDCRCYHYTFTDPKAALKAAQMILSGRLP